MMRYIKNAAVILGVVASINGLLIVFFDEDTPIGRFYERLWFHTILNLNARQNVYNPFSEGNNFTIYYDNNFSHLDRDYSIIKDNVGGRVFTASQINTRFPQGIIAFANSLPNAEYKGRTMNAAVHLDRASRPEINILIPEGISTSQSTYKVMRYDSLEQFCTRHQTYHPEQLCFTR